MGTAKPDFLQIGAIVKVQYWYGQIVDVAVSDTRIMLLITSPKALWRHHPAEWLEFDPQQITPCTLADALAGFDDYVERVSQTLRGIEAMKKDWQQSNA
jgi:hypothetical protein